MMLLLLMMMAHRDQDDEMMRSMLLRMKQAGGRAHPMCQCACGMATFSFTFHLEQPDRVTICHDDASTEDKGQLCVVLPCHRQDEDGLDGCRLCSATYVCIVDRTVFESNCGPFGRDARGPGPEFSFPCLSLCVS